MIKKKKKEKKKVLNCHTQHIRHLPPRTVPRQRIPPSDQRTPPPIPIPGEDEIKIVEIMDGRLHYNKLKYQPKWKGYLPEHDTV